MLLTLIESLIDQALVDEEAIGFTRAKELGLALFIGEGYDNNIAFTLIDPKIVMDKLEKGEKLNFEIVVAYLELSTRLLQTCNGYTVAASAAKKGLGPLIYDIGMAWATRQGHGLVSDRKSITPDARKIWQYYYNHRNDVNIIPIMSPNCKAKSVDFAATDTKPTKIEREFLDNLYMAKKPIVYNTFINNGKRLQQILSSQGKAMSDLAIQNFGDSFFSAKL